MPKPAAALTARLDRLPVPPPVPQARARKLGEEHPDTLSTRNQLGACLSRGGGSGAQQQQRLGEAEALLRASLSSRTRVLGAKHPETLRSMHDLAAALEAAADAAAAGGQGQGAGAGQREEAVRLYRSVLEARKRALGPEHPETLRSMAGLGSCLNSAGQASGAPPHSSDTA